MDGYFCSFLGLCGSFSFDGILQPAANRTHIQPDRITERKIRFVSGLCALLSWTWTADEWKLKVEHRCLCAHACVLSWRQYCPSLTLGGHQPLTYLFFFSASGRKVDHSLISEKECATITDKNMEEFKSNQKWTNSRTKKHNSPLNESFGLLLFAEGTLKKKTHFWCRNSFKIIFHSFWLLRLCWQKHWQCVNAPWDCAEIKHTHLIISHMLEYAGKVPQNRQGCDCGVEPVGSARLPPP